MAGVEDYVARVEGTCGEEKDVIVTFKYDKKDEAIEKVLKKAKTERSISNVIFELRFKSFSFRLYGSGKVIFRSMKDREQLNTLLSDLLL